MRILLFMRRWECIRIPAPLTRETTLTDEVAAGDAMAVLRRSLVTFRALVDDAVSDLTDEAGTVDPLALPDLQKIGKKSLQLFHLLHQLLGPEEIKSIYSLGTIRTYRRELRSVGFDYPMRPHIPGPGRKRVACNK